MKTWLKILSIVLAVTAISIAVVTLSREEKECCLCNSFRYHAPCLIDLETGEMIELDLYFPHETKVAELAEEQPEMGTFSFVRLGNVSGTKLTDSKEIEILVPKADKTNNPALCKKCRELLQPGYRGRYVLADLYSKDAKELMCIEDGTSVSVRCYDVCMIENKEKEGTVVTIQGTLEDAE